MMSGGACFLVFVQNMFFYTLFKDQTIWSKVPTTLVFSMFLFNCFCEKQNHNHLEMEIYKVLYFWCHNASLHSADAFQMMLWLEWSGYGDSNDQVGFAICSLLGGNCLALLTDTVEKKNLHHSNFFEISKKSRFE
jgi:hypothetical protein